MVSVVVTVENFQQKEILEINRPNCIFPLQLRPIEMYDLFKYKIW